MPYLASRQSAHHHKKQRKEPSQRGVYLMFAIILAIAVGTYLAAWGLSLANSRGGSVCLNSSGRFVKWISASIMPPPSLASAR